MPEQSPSLLSPRNAVLGACFVLLASLATALTSAVGLNDSDGWGEDTFGTRGDGYRGVFELLGELGADVSRAGGPPLAGDSTQRTIVLWGPDPQLAATNPTYLEALVDWVKRGGRLVVAPRSNEVSTGVRRSTRSRRDSSDRPRDVLKLLGVRTTLEKAGQDKSPDASASRTSTTRASIDLPELVAVSRIELPGEKAGLSDGVERLALPESYTAHLRFSGDDTEDVPFNALVAQDEAGNTAALAAVIPRGKGEIVVVDDPRLFCNELLAKADNAVLAARIFCSPGRPIVFDEFYHGLGAQGNMFYLLTKPGFAAISLAFVAALAGVTWRATAFLGPPLPDRPSPRRHIGEYVDAMGHFFLRAPDAGRFLLGEIREGVLRRTCLRLGLPPETSEKELIVAALARRDRPAALRLEQALAAAADESHSDDRRIDLPLAQRLLACQ